MTAEHISDHDLERYYLGMVTDEEELAPLEEHLMWCSWCVERAEQTQDYVECDAGGFNGKDVIFRVCQNRQLWRSNYAATSAWTEMGNIWPPKIVPIGR